MIAVRQADEVPHVGQVETTSNLLLRLYKSMLCGKRASSANCLRREEKRRKTVDDSSLAASTRDLPPDLRRKLGSYVPINNSDDCNAIIVSASFSLDGSARSRTPPKRVLGTVEANPAGSSGTWSVVSLNPNFLSSNTCRVSSEGSSAGHPSSAEIAFATAMIMLHLNAPPWLSHPDEREFGIGSTAGIHWYLKHGFLSSLGNMAAVCQTDVTQRESTYSFRVSLRDCSYFCQKPSADVNLTGSVKFSWLKIDEDLDSDVQTVFDVLTLLKDGKTLIPIKVPHVLQDLFGMPLETPPPPPSPSQILAANMRAHAKVQLIKVRSKAPMTRGARPLPIELRDRL